MAVSSATHAPKAESATPEVVRLSNRRSPRLATFLAGVAIVTIGVVVMRSTMRVDWLLPGLRSQPWMILNGDVAVLGGLIAIIGATVAALAGRQWVPDRIGAVRLPPPGLHPDRRAFFSLVVGVICLGVLYGRLAARQYMHADIALFFIGLGLVALAIWRSDSGDSPHSVNLQWRDVAAILMLFAGTIVVNSVAITRWDFGWTGDEGSFFIMGNEIANTGRFNFFSLRGVYETHPVLDSAYMGGVMKLFGQDIRGWRMSQVLVLGVTAILMYAAVSLMVGRAAGLVAAVIVGTNHFLMAFARIAYNNLHVVFYTTLVVFFLALAWRTQRAVFVFAAGIAMGFCLYTLQVAMLIWPIIGIFLATTLVHRPFRHSIAPIMVLALGYVLVVTPALIATSPQRVLEVARQNTQREQALTNHAAVATETLIDSLVVLWMNVQWRHHHVGGPLLDIASGVLFFTGAMLALVTLKNRSPRMGLFWFAFGIGMLALSAYAPGPSFTRMLFLVPAVAILCGLAAEALTCAFRSQGVRLARIGPIVGAALVLAIPALNTYQLIVDSPTKLPSNRSAMILKMLEDYPNNTIVHVGPWPSADQNIMMMVKWYPWLIDRYRYAPIESIQSGEQAREAGRAPLFVPDPEDRGLSDRLATRLGPTYEPFTESDYGSRYRITVYQPASARVR